MSYIMKLIDVKINDSSDLSDAVILLLQGEPVGLPAVVVVVGGIWFGCFWLLVHHGFDRCHVDRSVPDREHHTGAFERSVLTN